MIQFSQMQASFNAATTITDVAKLIGEVRDRLDIVHTSEFANFMQHLFPILRDLVAVKTSPQLEDNAENKVRHSLLEIFNKFPNNETLKLYVYEIMILSLKVLADDNEENAIVALKIIFDLHKSFRPSLEQYILPFLDTVSRLYANMPAASRAIYGSSTSPTLPTSPTLFVRSVESFKVLTECPIIVMLLFQFYPRFVAKTMTQMVPVMLTTLSLSPAIAANAVAYPHQRQRYREFLAAQVKTLSFLTFLLRSYSDFLKAFEQSIVKSVLMLLHRCPEESVGTRKELLIATRHILATDFRRGFQPHLDDLLDEGLFLGPGQPASLRPVAYSTIGDLVHHMKETLSLTQIVKVANMFAVTIQDLTLPVNLHVSGVRVLFTIVERLHLAELGDDSISTVQYLLHHIFRNLVQKLGVLRLHIEQSFDLEERVKSNANYLEERDSEGDSDEKNSALLSNAAQLPNTSAIYLFREDSAAQEQTVREVKSLVKTIMGGMKVCCQTVQSVDKAAKQTLGHPVAVSTPDRLLLHNIAQMTLIRDHVAALVRLFRFSVECGGYFLQDRADRFSCARDRNTDVDMSHVLPTTQQHLSGKPVMPLKTGRRLEGRVLPSTPSPEIVEHVTLIAGSLSLLDPKTLSQVLHSVMVSFIGSSPSAPKENYFFTAVIEMLLTSYMPIVNFVCLQAVFSTVTARIGGYGTATNWTDSDCPNNPKRLCAFETQSALGTVLASALKSLQRYPENETALSSKLHVIVSEMLKVANLLPLKDLRRSNCLHTLRLLFKTLRGKQLRISLQTFRALFPTSLQSLEGLLARVLPPATGMRCEILELICSLPLDPESLLAHTPALLGHIRRSLELRGHEAEIGELYLLALVMLEGCVDVLTLGTLSETLLANPDVTEGLYREISRHIQPKPYPLGELASRLMGKIGCCFAFIKASNRPSKHGPTQSNAHSTLMVQAPTCLFPLDTDSVICSSIPIRLNTLIIEACEVFLSNPILPTPTSDAKTVSAMKVQSTSPRGHTGPKSATAPTKLRTLRSATVEPPFGTVDPHRPCLDTAGLQGENTTIVESARFQFRLDALRVLEGSVACMLAPLIQSLHCEERDGEESSAITTEGPRSDLAVQRIGISAGSNRMLLSHVLSSVYKAAADPVFEDHALSVMRSALYLVPRFTAAQRNSNSGSSRLLEDLLDAVIDVILQPIDGFHVSSGSSNDLKLSATSRLLREYLAAASGSETLFKSRLNAEPSPRIREVGCVMFSIPPEDGCVGYLVARCLSSFTSNIWGGRVVAAYVLHDLCELLPSRYLAFELGDIVEGILSALEFPFSLMGLCGVESLLRTLRVIIHACLINSRLKVSTVSSDSLTSDPSDISAASCDRSDKDVTVAEDGESLRSDDALTEQLLQSLVCALFHPSPPVGIAARTAIGEIAKVKKRKDEGISVSSILLPLKDFINREICARLAVFAGSGNGHADQGYISGVTYCCNLSPPLVVVGRDIMALFASALHTTEEETIPAPLSPFIGGAAHSDPSEDDLLLTLQMHPYPVHPAVIRRLLFVRFTHALCHACNASQSVAEAVLNEDNKSTLQRTFCLLFKGLGSAWDDIGGWSQRTLHLLIGLKATSFVTSEVYESIFPRDLLQQCLQPLLVPLSCPRKVSLSGIRGIECVLRLVTNVKFLQFGDKILEHMRMFMDTEKLVATQLWEAGTEEWIASSLLDLLHLLPWLPNSGTSPPHTSSSSGDIPSPPKQVLRAFLYNFATTVSDLDTAWRRYRPAASSPFIPPFAKFLTRYPVEAVKFFFSTERILDQELCELLLQVLDSDCGCVSKFEKILASSDSICMLLKICLNSFVKKDDEKDKETEDKERRADGGVGGESSGGSKAPVPLLKLGALSSGSGAEEEGTQQRNAILAYNALRLIKKLSDRCPCVLYSNPALLSTLRLLVPECLAVSEGSNSSPILHTSLLPYSDYSLHQGATVAMENIHRNAHQLKLLCEIIIQYCRANPADSNTPHSSEIFEQMSFSLLPVLTMKLCIIDFTFLLDFFKSEVPYLCSSSYAKKQILRKTFSLVAGKRASVALKVKVIQVVALPLLIKIFIEKDTDEDREQKGGESGDGDERKGDREQSAEATAPSSSSSVSSSSSRGGVSNSTITYVFDSDMIQLIMQDVIGMTSHGITSSSQGGSLERTASQDRGEGKEALDKEAKEGDQKEGYTKMDTEAGGGDDLERGGKREGAEKDALSGQSDASNLKIELLKVSTLFLEHLFPLFKLFKKDIIKFAWNHIKADDSATRHWAYINICRFVASFDSPPKIIIQVYVALLRSFHPEGRDLIRRALDTLVPVLPARLLPEDFYKVVKWTKKILADDGYSMPQLCHIWHMIIRFSDVFYLYRSQLVPQMLNAITRIGLSGNAATEFRLVAVAIADLVISWEIKRPDRMPVFMSGNAPSAILTPPLPLIRKRLPSDEVAPVPGPNVRKNSESSEPGGRDGEDGERASKRSKHDADHTGGAAGPHYISMKGDTVPSAVSATHGADKGTAGHTAPADVVTTDSRKRLNPFSEAQSATGEGQDRPQVKPVSRSVPQSVSSSGIEREGADESYILPKALVQILANFVMRLCLFASDNKDPVVSKLSSRCLRLFEKMSSLPAMKSVPLPYYERLLQNALDSFNSIAPPIAVDPTGGPGGPASSSAPPTDKPLSKPSSSQSLSSSSRANATQGFSDIMLCNFLDIASSSLTCVGGPNKLFEQNAYLLKELHAPVFASESPTVHECYKKFLRTVLTVYPCSVKAHTSLETSGFLKQLVGVVSLGLKVKVSSPKEAQSLLLLLQAVSAACGAQSTLVENFGSALLRIGHVMLGDHVQGAVGRANRRRRSRTGMNSGQSDIRSDILCREFHEDSCLSSLLIGTAVAATDARGKRGEDPSDGRGRGKDDGTSSLEDLSGKILTCCLCVLFQSIDRGCLEQQKPVIVSLLAAAVEGVDNMLLVNLASAYCLKWVGRPCSPLSLGEQVVVFSRINCHSMRLQADCKQAVLARFSAVSERIGELTCSSKRPHCSSFDSSDYRLGPLALMSPVRDMRDSCLKRVLIQWGPTLYGRLRGLLSLDLTSQYHSQWPGIIATLALEAVDVTDLTVTTGSSHCSLTGHNLVLHSSSDEPSDDVFISGSSSGSVWLRAMGNFILSNPASGNEICVAMLQGMWGELDQKRRDELTMAVANNIIQAKHTIPVTTTISTSPSTYCHARTVPQQLLLLLTRLRPTPRFPVEFITCLGLGGCEGDAAPLLEAMVSSSHSNKEAKQCRTALLASLDRLGDSDLMRSLFRTCSASRVTDLALSLETYGRSNLAQAVVVQAITASSEAGVGGDGAVESLRRADDATADLQHVAFKEADDIELWECRWIKYAKELSEWSVLSNFAVTAGVTDLAIESAVSLGDWENVKRLKTSSASLLTGCGLKMRMFDGMLSLVERRYPEATEAVADATQMALYKWLQLPAVSGSTSCHRTMMASLQQLLELDEGKNMLLNAQSCSTARMLPDLSTGLAVWRERLPDRGENMVRWDALLHWRANLFAGVTRIFRGGPDDSRLAAVTDGPWTTLQLVAAARRHRLFEVGLRASQSLQTLTTLDVTDAFSKVREQVLLCLSSTEADSTAGGLNIVNTTNLDFFCPDQRAEMFRLKGLCNRELGHISEAQDCFSQSVQLGAGKRGRDWLSWGHLCHHIWEKETFKPGPENGVQGAKKIPVRFCSDHAMSASMCVLKAVECDSTPAIMLLPRAIWVLECAYSAVEGEEGMKDLQQLVECFIAQACEMPLRTWTPYLTSLLSLLNRPGGGPMLPLLQSLLSAYPQCVITHLMNHISEESAGCGVLSSDSARTSETVSTPISVGKGNHFESLIHLAKQTHSALWMRIGWFSKAIKDASQPCMLGGVSRGLKALAKEYQKRIMSAEDKGEMKRGLLMGIRACFPSSFPSFVLPSLSSLSSGAGAPHTATHRTAHTDLINTFRQEFEPQAFPPDISSHPTQDSSASGFEEKNFSDILGRLLYWIGQMTPLVAGTGCADSCGRYRCGDGERVKTNNRYNYYEFDGDSHTNIGVCLPTQHLPFGGSKHGPSPVKVIRVTRYSGVRGRGVEILGSDGVLHRFSVAGDSAGDVAEVQAQERYARLASAVNWTLAQHMPSRVRALGVRALTVMCVGDGVTLVEERGLLSLGDVYTDHCGAGHEDPNWLLSTSCKYLLNERGDADGTGDTTHEERRRTVYNEACNLIPSTVLRDRFTASCQSLSEVYRARREYASQTGLNAAVQLLLSATALTPSQSLLCPVTGEMVSMGVTPCYKHSEGEHSYSGLERNEDLPFRLTRNIVGALSGAMILGGTVVCVGLCMDACLANRDVMEATLSVLLCEDMRVRRGARNGEGDWEEEGGKSPVGPIKDMVISLLSEFDKTAPSTQICNFEKASNNGDAKILRKLPLPLPVDFNIQGLVRRSMAAENIMKINDLSWLPWM